MESPSLMDLNDDCLESVLQYFNLQDLVKIRSVCSRLDVVTNRFRHKYFNFNVHDHSFITINNIAKVLQFLGPTMKSFYCDGMKLDGIRWNKTKFLECLGLYCTSLEKLVLRCFGGYRDTVHPSEIYQLMTPNLKSFTLESTILSFDYSVDIFENAPNLEEFVLSGGEQHNIKSFFKQNTNLKFLSFIDVDPKPKFLKEALKYNLNLEKLILTPNDCCSLHNTLVKFISKNLTNLTELSFNAYDSFKLLPFGDLPKLKKLTIKIFSFSDDFEALLEKLVEKNIIEELHIIPDDCADNIMLTEMSFELFGKMVNLKKFSLENQNIISDANFKHLQKLSKLESLSIRLVVNLATEGLLELVSNNQNLKYLDAYSGAIDGNFLMPLINVLKKSQERPKMEFRGFYEEDFYPFYNEEELSKILKGNEKFINVIFDKWV